MDCTEEDFHRPNVRKGNGVDQSLKQTLEHVQQIKKTICLLCHSSLSTLCHPIEPAIANGNSIAPKKG